ncbi:MAG: protein translocase subunit SecD [Verrucomicrobiota bacterium JB023]|nr:protein translocase subunit SecD [Verrucomicrobiota bacterium JB023]
MNHYLIFFTGLAILGLLFAFFAAEKEKNKRTFGTIATLIIGLLCVWAISSEGLKPGIDLAGGSTYTLRVDPKKDDDGTPIKVTRSDIQQVIKVIEQRLNPEGTRDMTIQALGEDRVTVELPGVTDKEAAEDKAILEKQSVLELRAVHPDNNRLAAAVDAGIETRPPGYELLQEPVQDRKTGEPILDDEGNPVTNPILVKRGAEVKGSQIKRAQADYAQPGTVAITLTDEGGNAMREYTKNLNVGTDRMAQVLDGEVIGAPGFRQVPLGKNFVINGIEGGTQGAELLAQQLMNPLENPLKIEANSNVSARSGEATIKQGIYAGIAGLALTFLFVLLYYRFAGLIALVGLMVNILMLFGFMAMFGFTFTLPGIAGIVLTIGVAVDANVLIYERMREELKAGRNLKTAIKNAYDKAFSAIFDANITTLITATILFWRASGTVKGFAVTLTIGILATLFVALIVTRILFWYGTDTGVIKKLSFVNIIPEKVIDFMSYSKRALFISVALFVIAAASFGIRYNSALGVDFSGGTMTRYEIGDTEIPVDDVKDSLASLDLSKNPQIQEERSASGFSLVVRSAENDVAAIDARLRESFPEILNDSVEGTSEFVSAALGKEFLINSLIALGIGLVGILIYIAIRFQPSFALGAFIALAHDVIIVLGLTVLLGRELSLIHVGAILTIAGYSINDTIIVFDRIRETLEFSRSNLRTVINESISATLSRTILTSSTTFVAVLVLLIFGGADMREFSLTMVIGIVVGTYSSIFVAAPVVEWIVRKRGTDLRREILDANLDAQMH